MKFYISMDCDLARRQVAAMREALADDGPVDPGSDDERGPDLSVRCNAGIPIGPLVRGMWCCVLDKGHDGPHEHGRDLPSPAVPNTEGQTDADI